MKSMMGLLYGNKAKLAIAALATIVLTSTADGLSRGSGTSALKTTVISLTHDNIWAGNSLVRTADSGQLAPGVAGILPGRKVLLGKFNTSVCYSQRLIFPSVLSSHLNSGVGRLPIDSRLSLLTPVLGNGVILDRLDLLRLSMLKTTIDSIEVLPAIVNNGVLVAKAMPPPGGVGRDVLSHNVLKSILL